MSDNRSFLVPAPPPPAHLHLPQVPHIKAEPIEDETKKVVNYEESSHDEILHSEFGQTAREVVPSGRTVLGTKNIVQGHEKRFSIFVLSWP